MLRWFISQPEQESPTVKPDTATRKIVIEKEKRFSQSSLWRIQRDYFDREGINAWVNQVPFYITSNPFIAKSYARIVLAFLQDWVRLHPEARKNPFHILEIGTGSGRFSFYFVKTLHEMLKESDISDVEVIHVMSDFTRSNMRYWEPHHAIRPLVEQGLVDFALYDLDAERPITLIHKKTHLDRDTLTNPLIVFGNYIFDTCLNDMFALKEGKLFELYVNLAADERDMQGNWPSEMEKLDVSYEARKVSDNLYGDPVIDQILTEYRTHLKETIFMLPTGAFRALRYLKKIANNRLFMLSTDKGYSALHTQDGARQPPIYFHGSFFSAMVNFHAIGRFFENDGGDSFLQTPRRGIKTSAFSSGFHLKDMPSTLLELRDRVEGFSPADYFALHRRMSDSFGECTLDIIASHLQLSEWDPHIFMKISSRIMKLAPESDRDTISFLSENMSKIAANYYDMPQTPCVLFEIAVFFHTIRNYEKALQYYEQAALFVKDKYSLLYNSGLCLHYLGRNEQAVERFREAVSLSETPEKAAEWVDWLEKNPTGLRDESSQAPTEPV